VEYGWWAIYQAAIEIPEPRLVAAAETTMYDRLRRLRLEAGTDDEQRALVDAMSRLRPSSSDSRRL
jgi:hypothetical protein